MKPQTLPCVLPSVLENHKTDILELRTKFVEAHRTLHRVNASVAKLVKTLTKESRKERASEEEATSLRSGAKTLNDKTATQTVLELLEGGEKSLDQLVNGFLNRKQVFTNSMGLKATVAAAVGELKAAKVIKRVSAGVYSLRGNSKASKK